MKARRILSAIIAAVITAAAIPAGVSAAEYKEGYYTYTVSDGDATITKVNPIISGDVVIPETLGGNKVFAIGKNAFKGCTKMTGIDIAESVKRIDAYAFYGCTGLKKITIPYNVREIGDYAFANCVKVTELNYNVEEALEWDDGILYDGHYGQSHHIFDEIGAESTGVTVNFGEKVTKVPDYMFRYEVGKYDEGENIVTVNFLGTNVVTIGTRAFSNLKTLKTVKSNGEAVSEGTLSIPESVTYIGTWAFWNCEGIEKITIPSGVKTIDSYAFSDCVNVTELNYNVEEALEWDDGILYDGHYGQPHHIFDEIGAESTGVTVNFGEKVTKVPDYMFCYSVGTYDEGENIKEVYFHGTNAVTVGKSAFNGIETLTDVYVAGSVLRWAEFEIYENNEPLLSAELHLISSGVTGDANNDSKISLFDASAMLQFIAGWSVTVNNDCADVTGDGKVNLMDVTLVLQYIAGWDVVLK